MNILQKVIGKKCGKPPEECPQAGVLKDASAYLCESCNSELAPVTAWNRGAVAVAALVAVAVLGAVGYMVSPSLPGGLVGQVADPSPRGHGAVIELAIQDSGAGDSGVLPADHVFHSGDRFRLLLRSHSSVNIYAFYEDRLDGRMKWLYPDEGADANVASDGIASIPGDKAWIHLDGKTGTERFVILASATPLRDLRFESQGLSREEFDRQLDEIRKGPGLTEAKFSKGKDWSEAKGSEDRVLLARLAVEHRD